jgi:hypothetical protein
MSDGVNADKVQLALDWLNEASHMRQPDLAVGPAVMDIRESRADTLEECARALLQLSLDEA